MFDGVYDVPTTTTTMADKLDLDQILEFAKDTARKVS